MIRKFTAITLLSMASIVMLAFVVFPHHHHNEYICFATVTARMKEKTKSTVMTQAVAIIGV